MSVLIFLVFARAPDKEPETTSEDPSFPTLVLNEGVEAEIERIRTAHRIPGLGVVLVVRNKGIWAKGFGQVNIDSPRLVDAHTPFMLASISKTFVATAMLQEIGFGTFS
ncbi:MAG: serine hydrolase domain-containing protein, partial [Myxococcota bacterium]|nr:serine hydrolase domain-containing protein [Myxococcota bacterium]